MLAAPRTSAPLLAVRCRVCHRAAPLPGGMAGRRTGGAPRGALQKDAAMLRAARCPAQGRPAPRPRTAALQSGAEPRAQRAHSPAPGANLPSDTLGFRNGGPSRAVPPLCAQRPARTGTVATPRLLPLPARWRRKWPRPFRYGDFGAQSAARRRAGRAGPPCPARSRCPSPSPSSSSAPPSSGCAGSSIWTRAARPRRSATSRLCAAPTAWRWAVGPGGGAAPWRVAPGPTSGVALQGDAQHWLACALYAACRRSVLPTVGSGVMEGNCVSLTRILRSARLRCAARGSAEAEGRLKPMITQRFLCRLFFFVFVFPFKPDSVL